MDYLTRLVESKVDDPSEDVTSDLAERLRAGEITAREAGLLALQLLVAGHETSANMIALGTLTLLRNPEQLAVFRESNDPKVIATRPRKCCAT
jgi:cytochrome P450